jgi:hypothetical protein
MTKPDYETWSQQEDDFLRDHQLQGFSMSQIARLMADAGLKSRSRNSLIGRWNRLSVLFRQGVETGGKRTLRAVTRMSPASVIHSVRDKAEPRVFDGDPVRFLDRAFDQCAWVIDESAHIMDRFVCGAPVLAGRSWCSDCAAVVYGRGTPSERSAIRDAAAIIKVAA